MNENSSSSLNALAAEGDGASSSLNGSLRDRSAGAGAGAAAGAAAMPITRTGKIARLPQAIRQRLNERLADGEPQHLLVAWLNEHAVVRERLERFHSGRWITEQNLSDWKAGGFRDWERHQETRGMLREFVHEAEELSAELGEEELLEKLTTSVALMLMRLYKEALAAEPGPEQRQAVLQIARQLNRMKRVNHERQRVQLMAEGAHQPSDQPRKCRENWREINREMEEMEKEQAKDNAWLRVEAEALRAEYVAGMENRALPPERRQYIEEFYEDYHSSVEVLDLEPLPTWREPRARAEKGKTGSKKKQAAPGAVAKTQPTEPTAPKASAGTSPAAGSAVTDPE